jgi:hypothetical protein
MAAAALGRPSQVGSVLKGNEVLREVERRGYTSPLITPRADSPTRSKRATISRSSMIRANSTS